VAGVIRDRLRPGDHAGRWGGEEFLVVLPGASLEDGARVLERVRRSVEALEIDWGGQALGVTLSAGISAYPEVIRSPSGAVASADAALYKAKRSGRNAVALADPRR
jgi:diguanylate cyclase (GGDEF)-like protein